MTKALNLKDLPSKTKYYNKFDGASGSECNGEIGGYSQWEDTLKGKLNDYRELTTSAKKIGGAYCSACNMNTSKQTDAEPCQFFYHWLGDKYWNDLGNKNLSDLLSAIYQTLKGDNPSNKCRFQYSDVNKDLLPQMKKVFDYYYEHTTIYDGLMKNGLNCKDELYTYLKEVSSACITMRNNCPNTTTYTSGSYCKDFHDTYEVPCGVAEALDSYCTTNSALEVAQKGKAEAEASKEVAQKESAQAQSQLKEALSKASTSSTLSSTFGTLAAMEFPALAYFLFKVSNTT
ncbi:KIR protein [Plasmodium coatneyi]|uniref:KIR protein n=1 Tax=Plasmodium coatneyi TaxID=208452 RepID=A0A1B1DW27_9APIC|nr:KIR protein [Plasmodium coatneyi]ANQ06968.1 KIR protein [Plasmodium coatneyi]